MPPNNRSVFDYLLPVQDDAGIMSALRLAGLPLSCTTPDPEHGDGIDENDASKIVCIAEIGEHISKCLVVTPSGLLYHLDFTEFAEEEKYFLAFAMRYFYVVTGNMPDRQHIASQVDMPVKNIKGRLLLRKKSGQRSNLTIDGLLAGLGYVKTEAPTDGCHADVKPVQRVLF